MDATFVLKERNANGDVDVYYVYPDGSQQQVSENQDLYAKWKAEGNVAKVVERYVAPAAVSIETQIANAESQRAERYHNETDDTLMAIQAYTLEGDTDKADALKAKWLAAREEIRTAIPTPKE